MAGGVKVVGGPGAGDPSAGAGLEAPVEAPETVSVDADAPQPAVPGSRDRGRRAPAPVAAGRAVSLERRRRLLTWGLAALAVLGIAGTVGFGLAWAGANGRTQGEGRVSAAARTFLRDLTNFDAKTVDADFSAVTGMATGNFAAQADRFFNSNIRQALQKALASSRGQIRQLYVQSYDGTNASVYAVVDQLYVNNKVTSPQSDVLRVLVDLTQVSGTWKISQVSVLQGPNLGAATTPATGSAGQATTPTSAAG